MRTRKKMIKVGIDGLGKCKGVSTVEQFFSRSVLEGIRNSAFLTSFQLMLICWYEDWTLSSRALEVQIKSKVILNLRMNVKERQRSQEERRSNRRKTVDKESEK